MGYNIVFTEKEEEKVEIPKSFFVSAKLIIIVTTIIGNIFGILWLLSVSWPIICSILVLTAVFTLLPPLRRSAESALNEIINSDLVQTCLVLLILNLGKFMKNQKK